MSDKLDYTRNGRGFQIALWSFYVPVFLIVAIIASYFLYIHFLGVNVLFWDDWDGFLPIYRDFIFNSGFKWNTLLALLKTSHNGNLMVIPFGFMIIEGYLTHLNSKVIMYTGAFFQCASFVLLSFLAEPILPKGKSRFWYLVPIACFLFSFCQYENILWDFQLAWFMIVLFLISALYLVDLALYGIARFPCFSFGIACATLASFSSLQGLAVWPAVAAYIALKRRPVLKTNLEILRDAFFATWTVCGATTILVFFMVSRFGGYGISSDIATHGRGLGGLLLYSLAHWRHSFRFLLASWEGVLLTRASQFPFMGVLLAIFLAIFLMNLYRSKHKYLYALPSSLVLFGLLFGFMLVIGRCGWGIDEARSSRYSTNTLILVVGLYLGLLSFLKDYPSEKLPYSFLSVKALFGSFLLTFILVNNSLGIARGRSWSRKQWGNVLILTHYLDIPQFNMERTIFPNPDFLKVQARFLRSHNLNVYRINLLSEMPRYYRELINPPSSYVLLENQNPQQKKALEQLWFVYTMTPDIMRTSRTNSITPEILAWACSRTRVNWHHMHRYLVPYALDYELLCQKLKKG